MMHKRPVTVSESMRIKEASIPTSRILNFNFTKSKSDVVLALLYLIFSVGYLAFVSHNPLQIVAYMAHDDAMFWTHAFSIVSGSWLGPYSQMTLPKGSGFPLVEAFGAIAGIPINIFSGLILIGALALLIRSLKTFGINRWFLFSGFLMTLAQMSLIMTRPLRDYIYASLVLVLIAAVLELSREPNKKDYLKFLLFGTLIGLFLVTREENPWVIPGVLLALIGVVIHNKRHGIKIQITALRTLIAVGGITFVHLVIMGINLASYGTFTTQDFTYGSFPKALSALQSVETFPQPRHVPVSKENRDAIYKVSPAFAELKPYFEGPGLFWTKFGCAIEGEPCNEYATGWFMWALRDAAARAGHYQSPRAADDYFQKIAGEVDAACNTGALKCSNTNVSVIPKFPPGAAQEVAPTISRILDVMFYKDVSSQPSARSEGDGQTLFLIRAFLGSPKIYPNTELDFGKFTGWVYAPNLRSFEVKCENSKPQAKINWLASPDLVDAYKDANASNSRFTVTYTPTANCILQVETMGATKSIPISEISQNKSINLSGGKMYIESSIQSLIDKPYASPAKIKQTFIDFNKFANPFLLIGGLISLLMAITIQAWKRRISAATMFIIPAFYVFISSRIILLVVVAITSFPAINEQYVLPATALIPFAGMLGFHTLFQEIRILFSHRKSIMADANVTGNAN